MNVLKAAGWAFDSLQRDSDAMEDCIFCKIVSGEIPSYKIYEDGFAVAVLDLFPNIKGQTLVIPKRHIDSYIFNAKDEDMVNQMRSTRSVAKLLEKKLKVRKVNLVFEGEFVAHLHSKVYPLVETGKGYQSEGQDATHFDSYPGFVTTLRGPKASDDELRKIQKEITGK